MKKTRFKAVVGLLVGLLVSMAVLAQPMTARADGESNAYSMYAAAASIAGSFSKAVSPVGGNSAWKDTLGDEPGKAGALMGFPDSSIFQDFTGWLFQNRTQNSMGVSIKSLEQLPSGYSGTVEYAQFGATLSAMGLDSTSTGFTDMGRWLTGSLAMLFYACAGFIDWLMAAPLALLQWLNPFKFFYNAIATANPELANALVNGDTSGISGPLKPAAVMMSNVYTAVSGIGWGLAVPLLAALTLFSWLVLNKGNGATLFKSVLIRVLFLAIGLPVLGGLYSQALDTLVDSGDTGVSTAQVVASRWVDFEGWVSTNQLAVPSGTTIAWDTNKQTPTQDSWSNLNDTVLAINNAASGNKFGSSLSSGGTNWEKVSSDTTTDSSSAWWAGWDLLSRYFTASSVSAADYASGVQAQLSEDNAKTWFKQLNEDADSVSASDLKNNGLVNGGSLSASHNGKTVSFSSGDKGLSKMATYNYLASTFDSNGISFYSLQITSSLLSTPQHKAVTLSGDGVLSALNWLSALVLLGSFTAIGIGYGIGVFIMVMKRSLKLFTSIPMAALGSIRAIITVISSVLVMIGGMFASVFIYLLVKQLLMIFPQITQVLINAGAGSHITTLDDAINYSVGGTVMTILGTLVTIILVLAFTIAAFRVRSAVVGGLEQIVDAVVNKLMPNSMAGMAGIDPNAKTPSKGLKVAGAAAGVGAMVAGNALGNRLIGGAGEEGAEGGESSSKTEAVEAGKKVAVSTAVGAAKGAITGGGVPGAVAGGAAGAAAGAKGVAAQKAAGAASGGSGGAGSGAGEEGSEDKSTKTRQVIGHGLKGAVEGAGRGMMYGGVHGALGGAASGAVRGVGKGVATAKAQQGVQAPKGSANAPKKVINQPSGSGTTGTAAPKSPPKQVVKRPSGAQTSGAARPVAKPSTATKIPMPASAPSGGSSSAKAQLATTAARKLMSS